MCNPYEELANAIVLQAVKDYRDARKSLARLEAKTPARQQEDTEVLSNKDSRYVDVLSDKRVKDKRVLKAKDAEDTGKVSRRQAKKTATRQQLDECASFFVSDWFKTLTNVDGKMLLEKLQKEDVK